MKKAGFWIVFVIAVVGLVLLWIMFGDLIVVKNKPEDDIRYQQAEEDIQTLKEQIADGEVKHTDAKKKIKELESQKNEVVEEYQNRKSPTMVDRSPEEVFRAIDSLDVKLKKKFGI